MKVIIQFYTLSKCPLVKAWNSINQANDIISTHNYNFFLFCSFFFVLVFIVLIVVIVAVVCIYQRQHWTEEKAETVIRNMWVSSNSKLLPLCYTYSYIHTVPHVDTHTLFHVDCRMVLFVKWVCAQVFKQLVIVFRL